jgi:hypothetical protein
MITIDRVNTYQPSRTKISTPIERTNSVEGIEVDRATKTPVFDRRRNNDRRRKNKGNALLESRSGKDRRKNSAVRHPSIDIEA